MTVQVIDRNYIKGLHWCVFFSLEAEGEHMVYERRNQVTQAEEVWAGKTSKKAASLFLPLISTEVVIKLTIILWGVLMMIFS